MGVYTIGFDCTWLKTATDTVATNATDTVATNATNIFSLATKNSGLIPTLATRYLYDLDSN